MLKSLVRRRIFEPLINLKTSSPKIKYWRELERTQYLSEQDLLDKQLKRLRDIVEYAYENNSFYRQRFEDAGIKPSDIKTSEDIFKIPILTKKDIRDNCGSLISSPYKKEELLCFKTGGSTGKSLEIYITEECSEIRNACARRHDRWSGWEVGEPIGAAWGNPKFPEDLKSKLRDALLCPYIYLDTMEINKESIVRFSEEWQQVSPSLLFGHAHSLFLLAQYVAELNIKTIKPKGIISTSMMLIPHERATIEKTFNLKVFDRYGCEEVSLIASECEKHEGMHLNVEHLFIEFLKDDGSHAESGEEGSIIITDLMNKAMPFIRYRVEDVGVPLDKKCSCGRGLPLMRNVAGRVADFLVKKDGTKVAGISIIENTLTNIPGIEQMQIIQNNTDNIILNIVPDSNFTKERESELKEYFVKLFEAKIHVEKVQTVEPEKNGKYRFSICNVK